MHIGLNAHLLTLPAIANQMANNTARDSSANDALLYRSAGINRYIHNLLLNLTLVDGENRYTVFLGDRRFAPDPRLALRLSRLPTIKPAARILWEQVIQPFSLKKEGIDLLHSLAFVIPLASPCPSVVTIYDLSFLFYAKGFKRLNRLYLSAFTRLSAQRAKRIIAISESTKRDVVRLLKVPPERIDVVYPGVEEICRPLPQPIVADFRRKGDLPEQMILFLGTLEPRKNVVHLIKAYARFRSQWEAEGGQRTKLVVAGPKGWLYEDIFAAVEALDLADDVIFPGYIPLDELPLWYNAAKVFVYPSLYEGFGLPPLEAMACGTPVIVADTSSLPEVVGQAGQTVSPQDVEGWAEAMRRVLKDEALRQAMSQRGLDQAANFSWMKMAQEMVQVYRRALDLGGA